MTPGIKMLQENKIEHTIHEYIHTPSAKSYGLEAAEQLNIPASQVFKTLVVKTDNNELAVGVVPVSSMLSMKLMAKALDTKTVSMADPIEVERSSGYVLGGVSPLGQKKRLRTIIDISAEEQQTIYISAGRRGLEVQLNPDDLVMLLEGWFAKICYGH